MAGIAVNSGDTDCRKDIVGLATFLPSEFKIGDLREKFTRIVVPFIGTGGMLVHLELTLTETRELYGKLGKKLQIEEEEK